MSSKASLKEVFTEMLCFNEAFDTNFDSIDWVIEDGSYIGNGKLDNDEFILHIEPTFSKIGDLDKSWLNIAFARLVDGKPSEEILNIGNQSRQFGAIIKALSAKTLELTNKFHIDALVFIVKKGEEKRLSLYKRLAAAGRLGLHNWRLRFSTEWDYGYALVLSEKVLSTQEESLLKTSIEESGKQINF